MVRKRRSWLQTAGSCHANCLEERATASELVKVVCSVFGFHCPSLGWFMLSLESRLILSRDCDSAWASFKGFPSHRRGDSGPLCRDCWGWIISFPDSSALAPSTPAVPGYGNSVRVSTMCRLVLNSIGTGNSLLRVSTCLLQTKRPGLATESSSRPCIP